MCLCLFGRSLGLSIEMTFNGDIFGKTSGTFIPETGSGRIFFRLWNRMLCFVVAVACVKSVEMRSCFMDLLADTDLYQ